MAETKSETIHAEESIDRHHAAKGTDVELSRKGEIDYGNEALLLRVDTATDLGLKLAKDGHTVLIPQPTSDESDPLNWPWWKKHSIVAAVALAGFCADFGSGAGVPAIIPQSIEWELTPNHVNYAGNLNVAMLGVGSFIWIPLSYSWGRAPVLFWSVLLGTGFTLGATLAPDFETFYAMRALMGITMTASQSIGLSYVREMFFYHEHARKIGIWACVLLLSPFCGPMFGNFIVARTGQWRNIFWLVFAVCCFDLALVVLFGDETWYRRDIPMGSQPSRGNRLSRLVGIWQLRHHRGYFLTVWSSFHRLLAVFLKPIMIPVMLAIGFSFMWVVGINVTSSILLETPQEFGGYGFSTIGVGYIYFTPIVSVALGEAFGHFGNDWVATQYVKRHNGIIKPEARLPIAFVAAFFMIPGLVLLGQALEHLLHYSAIIMGWGMFNFGALISTVAITTYLLDSYPNGAGEVAAFALFARTAGGFAVGYFQQPWGLKVGFDVSFGLQAVVVAVAFGILALVTIFGERLRAWGGPLKLQAAY